MATYEKIKCDNCGKECETIHAMNWIHIGIVGIDGRSFSDPVLPADLCSPTCVGQYLGLYPKDLDRGWRNRGKEAEAGK